MSTSAGGSARKLLYVVYSEFFPPYRGDAARIVELIGLFRGKGWRVDVAYCYDRSHPAPNCPVLATACDRLYCYFPGLDDPPPVAEDLDSWCPEPFARMVGSLCDRERHDVALAQLVFNTRCFEHVANRETVKVLDADNVFSLRHELFAEAGLPYSWLRPTLEQEARAWSRADLLVAVQEREAEVMRRALPQVPVVTVPACRETVDCRSSAGRSLLVVGNDSVPNRAGLAEFVSRALPAIRRRFPDARLLVAGRVGEGFHDPANGVVCLGVVDDLEACYRSAALVLAPVPAGTGLKRKTVDAICSGKCVVATPAAVQGLEEHPEAYVLCPSPAAMRDPVLRLLEDPARIDAVAARALAFASSYFDPGLLYDRLETAIAAAAAGKPGASETPASQ